MGGGDTIEPAEAIRAEGGETERLFADSGMGGLSEIPQAVPPDNPQLNALPDQSATPAPAHGKHEEIDPDEIITLLLHVMRGELDGIRTTTSERIRAGTLLMRWLLDGDALPTEQTEEDELSRAIEDYYRERDKPEPL